MEKVTIAIVGLFSLFWSWLEEIAHQPLNVGHLFFFGWLFYIYAEKTQKQFVRLNERLDNLSIEIERVSAILQRINHLVDDGRIE